MRLFEAKQILKENGYIVEALKDEKSVFNCNRSR